MKEINFSQMSNEDLAKFIADANAEEEKRHEARKGKAWTSFVEAMTEYIKEGGRIYFSDNEDSVCIEKDFSCTAIGEVCYKPNLY